MLLQRSETKPETPKGRLSVNYATPKSVGSYKACRTPLSTGVIYDLKKDLEIKNRELKNMKIERERLKDENVQIRLEMKSLNENLENIIKGHKNRAISAEKSNSVTKVENYRLKNRIYLLTKEIENYKNKDKSVGNNEHLIQHIRTDEPRYTHPIPYPKDDFTSYKKTVVEPLVEQYQQLQNEISDMRAELIECKGRFNEKCLENEVMSTQLSSIESDRILYEVSKEKIDLFDKLKSENEELRRKKEHILLLETKIKSLESYYVKYNKMKDELNKNKVTLTHLTEQKHELDCITTFIKNEFGLSSVSQLLDEYGKKNLEILGYIDEIGMLKAELNTKSMLIKENQDQISEHKTQLNMLEKKVGDLSVENIQLEKMCHFYKSRASVSATSMRDIG